MVTQALLKEKLHYDEPTGVFTWLKPGHPKAKVGSRAGHKSKSGYRAIGVCGRCYPEARLAWLYVTGQWPTAQVDHINRVRDDNRFINLRDATQSQNNANVGLRKDNTSGYVGVGWSPTLQKWRAYITIHKKLITLGHFNTPEEASAVRGAKHRALYPDLPPIDYTLTGYSQESAWKSRLPKEDLLGY